MQRKSLYLVDGNSYSYRAYYAIGSLSTSYGRPTGAIYGFVNMLNKLKNELKPDYLIVCFDVKGPTFRHERFKDYKIKRKPMPEELVSQMQIIKQIINAYGIAIFEIPGYEADDTIASLAMRFKNEADVYIVSGDKDMLQLVQKYVKIYNPQKENTVIDEEAVFARYQVKPSQIADLLALVGDASDNIPGVPGIGEKTAAQLINQFGNLENLLKDIDKVSPEKRRELFKKYATQALLSKELATVCTDMPMQVNLEKLKNLPEEPQTLRKIFQECEFKNLLKTLPGEDVFLEPGDVVFKTIKNIKQLSLLKKELLNTKEIAIFIQAHPQRKKEIISLKISKTEKEIMEIIVNKKITAKELKKYLRPIFEESQILKIGYDLKNVCALLENIGIYFAGPFFDLMVAAYLLEPALGTRAIEEIGFSYLERKINDQFQTAQFHALKAVLNQELKAKGLADLFFEIEMPLVRVLASMEISGVAVDRELLFSLGKEMEKKLTQLTQEIYKISQGEFNINSPKQLSEVLFERLKLPVIKKGKTGPSTDVEVLMRLAGQHTLPALILEYRELSKLKSTYIDGTVELIDPKTKRLHTSFNQTVTATGRLSSSSPNLQNIPIRTEMGKQIRAAFIARAANWQFVCADYSQIELRILAHLSQDKQLISDFKQDLDIHAATASLIFKIEKNQVTEKMRDVAKRVNFGIIYGMGVFGLAKDLGIPQEEARTFMEEYFLRYPQVKDYLQAQINEAKEKGYVTTLLNRRRYIPQINSQHPIERSFAERTAMNTPIQGTAADLIKAAMVDIYRRFKKERLKAVMVLQVHDELVFDVPQEEIDKVKDIVKQTMEHVLNLTVPIKISLKIGTNWRDLSTEDETYA